jgi:hypothetical protein
MLYYRITMHDAKKKNKINEHVALEQMKYSEEKNMSLYDFANHHYY